jgi:hypothetical protein
MLIINIREKKNKLTLQQGGHMVQVDDVNLKYNTR